MKAVAATVIATTKTVQLEQSHIVFILLSLKVASIKVSDIFNTNKA